MSLPHASGVSGMYFVAALTHLQSLLFPSFFYTCCMLHDTQSEDEETDYDMNDSD